MCLRVLVETLQDTQPNTKIYLPVASKQEGIMLPLYRQHSILSADTPRAWGLRNVRNTFGSFEVSMFLFS